MHGNSLLVLILIITDAKGREANALVIQSRGEMHNIWIPGWKPTGSTSMQDFLAEKIKTTLKKKKRIAEITQEETSFLDSDDTV